MCKVEVRTMPALSIDILFDAAIRIQLKEGSITVTFSADGIRIKFPTTRMLADFLEVPHYYILPYFAEMEKENLVTRAERVGIYTTPDGSKKILALMKTAYPDMAVQVFGKTVFNELLRKIN